MRATHPGHEFNVLTHIKRIKPIPSKMRKIKSSSGINSSQGAGTRILDHEVHPWKEPDMLPD